MAGICREGATLAEALDKRDLNGTPPNEIQHVATGSRPTFVGIITWVDVSTQRVPCFTEV